jgi:uncharacterized membrane protein
MPEIGKTLLIIGIAIAVLGFALMFWDKLPLGRFPLGRLPGDIVIDRPGFKFYFPITTGIIISVVLTLIMWLFRR